MADPPDPLVPLAGEGQDAAWRALRGHTAARIGLARTGASLGTTPLLEFRLAHVLARDAVHACLDEPALRAAIDSETLTVASQAGDRRSYLMRPNLGRALDAHDAARLAGRREHFDLSIVLGDGLSAQAVQRHAPAVLSALLPALSQWRLAPVVIARHARVALGDAIAGALGADAVLVLIGERPGLSAPDSLGAYLTWSPQASTLDSARNCVSNIRPDGLAYADAAFTLAYLLGRMRELGLSGVALKDHSGSGLLADERAEA